MIIPKLKVEDIKTGVVLTCSHLPLSQSLWKPKLYLRSFLSCLHQWLRRPSAMMLSNSFLSKGGGGGLHRGLMAPEVDPGLRPWSPFGALWRNHPVCLFVFIKRRPGGGRGRGESLLYKNNKINFLLVFMCGSVFWGGWGGAVKCS